MVHVASFPPTTITNSATRTTTNDDNETLILRNILPECCWLYSQRLLCSYMLPSGRTSRNIGLASPEYEYLLQIAQDWRLYRSFDTFGAHRIQPDATASKHTRLVYHNNDVSLIFKFMNAATDFVLPTASVRSFAVPGALYRNSSISGTISLKNWVFEVQLHACLTRGKLTTISFRSPILISHTI